MEGLGSLVERTSRKFLKPSKCSILTWQGRGKGGNVHRRISCPSKRIPVAISTLELVNLCIV